MFREVFCGTRGHFRLAPRTAAKYPVGGAGRGGAFGRLNGGWGVIRRRDGTVIKQ